MRKKYFLKYFVKKARLSRKYKKSMLNAKETQCKSTQIIKLHPNWPKIALQNATTLAIFNILPWSKKINRAKLYSPSIVFYTFTLWSHQRGPELKNWFSRFRRVFICEAAIPFTSSNSLFWARKKNPSSPLCEIEKQKSHGVAHRERPLGLGRWPSDHGVWGKFCLEKL